MWLKDDYQEHMYAYLDGMRIEFEQIAHLHPQEYGLSEFYAQLDGAYDCLWELIVCRESSWEDYRYPLEARCDDLLFSINLLLNAHSLAPVGVSFQSRSSVVLLSANVVKLKT